MYIYTYTLKYMYVYNKYTNMAVPRNKNLVCIYTYIPTQHMFVHICICVYRQISKWRRSCTYLCMHVCIYVSSLC